MQMHWSILKTGINLILNIKIIIIEIYTHNIQNVVNNDSKFKYPDYIIISFTNKNFIHDTKKTPSKTDSDNRFLIFIKIIWGSENINKNTCLILNYL